MRNWSIDNQILKANKYSNKLIFIVIADSRTMEYNILYGVDRKLFTKISKKEFNNNILFNNRISKYRAIKEKFIYFCETIYIPKEEIEGLFNGYIKKLQKLISDTKLTKSEETEEDNTIWKEIGDSILDKYDIITLKDSRQIMVKRSASYTFGIDDLTVDITHLLNNYGKINYTSGLYDVLNYIKNNTLFDRHSFDIGKWLIPFKNDVYSIKENKFLKDYNKKLFYTIPFEYEIDKKYKCRKSKRALRQWLTPKNVLRPSDIFEIIGYLMCGNNGLKTAFMNLGKTNTGRTRFTNIIKHIIGDENICNISLYRMNQNEFGTVGLQFKILNLHSEIEGVLTYISRFNAIVGGDDIDSEVKGGKQFSFTPTTRLMFNANRLLKLKYPDREEFYDRWIILQFFTQFERGNKKRIEEFDKIIIEDEEEVKGIIYESVKGVQRLYKRGQFRHELYKNTKHLWYYSSNNMYAFIYDNCEKGLDYKILVDEFFAEYNNYLFAKGNIAGVSKSLITRELQTFGVLKQRLRPSRSYFYVGIKWKDDYEVSKKVEEEIDIDNQFGVETKKGELDKYFLEFDIENDKIK